MRTEAEIRVMCPQAKEDQGLLETTRGQRRGSPSERPGGTTPALVLDLRPLEPGDNTFPSLKPPSLGSGVRTHGRGWWRQRWGQGPDHMASGEPFTNYGVSGASWDLQFARTAHNARDSG